MSDKPNNWPDGPVKFIALDISPKDPVLLLFETDAAAEATDLPALEWCSMCGRYVEHKSGVHFQ